MNRSKLVLAMTIVFSVMMVVSYLPWTQKMVLEGIAWADSKVSALTEKTTPPNPQTDWLYFIDMTETTAANRSKKISVEDLLRPKTVWVKHPNSFTTVGGESVYQIDPANGNVYMVDTSAIYLAGVTFDAVSGITILLPAAVAGISNVQVEIRKADSGLTPVQVWAYTSDGATFQRLWSDVSGATGAATNVADMDTGGDTRTYRICPDPESAVSAWPVCSVIQ